MMKQIPAPYVPLVSDLKDSPISDQSVSQAIEDYDDDLPTQLAPEPAGWDKDF